MTDVLIKKGNLDIETGAQREGGVNPQGEHEQVTGGMRLQVKGLRGLQATSRS